MCWVIFALIAFLGYGLNHFFWKLAAKKIDPFFATILFQSTSLILSVIIISIVFFITGKRFEEIFTFNIFGLFIIAAGFCASIADLCTITCLKNAPVSIVSPFIGLASVVPIVLGILILSETLTLKTGLGIVSALLAIVLISSE